VKIAFIIARKRNNVVVLFGTLKVRSGGNFRYIKAQCVVHR